jgi:DNA-binding transcriptional MerR regulator
MVPFPDVKIGNDEPLYNIGVVSRMTGISMATLRAWERRYEFPTAKRTSGGHRLYSERDIIQLQWVKERIEEGMQTSQSIIALHRQEQAGRNVPGIYDTIPEKVLPIEEVRADEVKTFIQTYRDRLFNALTMQDTQHSDEILGEVLTVSIPEVLILEIMAPVLSRIGEEWENGGLSIATEHIATNYIRHRLLMWMLNGPPPLKTTPIVLACAPGEWHEGSLLMIGALLRRRRWPVAYLGQSLPLPDLANFVRTIKPAFTVLVAMTEASAQNLQDWPNWMPEIAQNEKSTIGYGGRLFVEQPAWQTKLQGVYLGNTIEEGITNVEMILRHQ